MAPSPLAVTGDEVYTPEGEALCHCSVNCAAMNCQGLLRASTVSRYMVANGYCSTSSCAMGLISALARMAVRANIGRACAAVDFGTDFLANPDQPARIKVGRVESG